MTSPVTRLTSLIHARSNLKYIYGLTDLWSYPSRQDPEFVHSRFALTHVTTTSPSSQGRTQLLKALTSALTVRVRLLKTQSSVDRPGKLLFWRQLIGRISNYSCTHHLRASTSFPGFLRYLLASKSTSVVSEIHFDKVHMPYCKTILTFLSCVYNIRNSTLCVSYTICSIGVGTKGAMAPSDFTCYHFAPPPQIMHINLTILYNELVYYLHTHLLWSDTIK